MLFLTTTIMAKITIGTSMRTITMETTIQEIIMEGTTSTLITIIMTSKDKTDNGTLIQIMEAFLQTITTTMFSIQTSINMTVVKIHLTMMVHTMMEIKRWLKVHK